MVKNGYRSIKTQNDFLSLKEGNTVIVYDTETTGLACEKDDRILELSAEKFIVGTDYELNLIDSVQLFINPQFPIPPASTEVHGITDEFIADKPIEDDVIDEVFEWFPDGVIVCGHNVPFDNRFLTDMFERHGRTFRPGLVLDTLQAARDLVDSKSVPNHKLGTIAKLYGADEGMTFHTAKDDVHVCGKLLQIFLDEYKEKAELAKPQTLRPKTGEEMLASINCRKSELPKRVPYIKGMCLHMYHHANNNRLYFYTDCGSIWWDRYNKCWGHAPDKMKVPFESIDMEAFIKNALWLASVKDETELSRVNPGKETVWFNGKPWAAT